MKAIQTNDAPQPGGHYSPGILSGGQLFISGQLPNSPHKPGHAETSKAPFRAQARQAINNLLAVLAAAGGTPDHLAKVTVYIVDIAHWPAFNEEYAKALGVAKPARAVVPVPSLHHGYLVEIDAVAVGL